MVNNKLLFFFSFLMMHHFAYGWIGRVLPVSYDKSSGQWNILLGHDKGTDTWSDFKGDGSGTGLKANIVALKALSEQTNGQYNFINASPKMFYINDKDNWFHILPVNYISGRDLYDKARNNLKDDFKWISLDDVLKSKQVQHKKGGKIDDYLYWFIKNHAAKELEGKSPKKEEKDDFEIHQNVWPKPGNKDAIHFYDKNASYYEFTNTYPVEIYFDGHAWKSTEHYYQAGKFNDPWDAYDKGVNGQKALKDIGFGSLQKELRRDKYSGQKNKDVWESENLQRMLKALWAKFTQNKNLKNKLLETKNKIIVEDAGSNDPFYGAGADYKGENHLGQMLMQVRDLMLSYQDNKKEIPKDLPNAFQYQPYAPEKYLETYKNKKLMVNLPE